MRKPKHQARFDFDSNGDILQGQGRYFLDSHLGRTTDLSGVNLLGFRVDTVRQLYRGVLKEEVLELFEKPGLVSFAGYRWHASRVGRDSGYQFKLQNNDLGLIVLLKNFNCRTDQFGAHLKIEVSPHAIDALTPDRLQAHMDSIADKALKRMERNQCAVHLALDVQGWEAPEDFDARMHCRARAVRRFDGVKSFEWADKSAIFGRGQSFLFGSANGLQLAIYNKSLQAKAIDKLDYWESKWRQGDNPFEPEAPENYDSEKPVWRVEFRFHHSVVQQFADGSICTETGSTIATDSYVDLVPHLTGLWRYALSNFSYLSRPGIYDPFWTLINDEVVNEDGSSRFVAGDNCLADTTEYRRYYKTARGFSGKSVDLLMGNFISLLARERVGATKGFAALKTLPVWDVIKEHYENKDMTERDIYKLIKERLEERVIRWGRAI